MKKNLNINKDDIKIVDGKVVISNKEVANAFSEEELDLNANEEENAWSITFSHS